MLQHLKKTMETSALIIAEAQALESAFRTAYRNLVDRASPWGVTVVAHSEQGAAAAIERFLVLRVGQGQGGKDKALGLMPTVEELWEKERKR